MNWKKKTAVASYWYCKRSHTDVKKLFIFDIESDNFSSLPCRRYASHPKSISTGIICSSYAKHCYRNTSSLTSPLQSIVSKMLIPQHLVTSVHFPTSLQNQSKVIFHAFWQCSFPKNVCQPKENQLLIGCWLRLRVFYFKNEQKTIKKGKKRIC